MLSLLQLYIFCESCEIIIIIWIIQPYSSGLYDCPNADEVTLNDMFVIDQHKTTTKYKQNAYRQISYISCSKSQHIDVCRLVMQLSLLNPLKPGV